MRPRDVRAPLWDMLHAAEAIARFIEGLDFKDYERDLMLRSAVERQFEILGEAMTRALSIEPELAGELDEARGVVDFRNVIAHEYDRVSDRTVWDLASERLSELREAVRSCLENQA